MMSLYPNSRMLETEAMQSWSEISKEVPKKNFKLDGPKKEIARAHEAYLNGLNTYLPLVVLGASSVRSEPSLIENFGTLATASQTDQKKMRKFFLSQKVKQKEVKKVVAGHLSRGSIVNDSNWWIFRNDAFMIGAIEGMREFHLAGGKPKGSLLWDAKNKRPRVLGRELLMLAKAGYQRIESKRSLGVVFALPPGVEPKFTLSEYRGFIKGIGKKEAFMAQIDGLMKVHTNTCARDLKAPKKK